MRGFLRGVATIGSNGFGFIAVAPCLANDAPSVYFSSSAFNSTTISLSTVTPQAGTLNSSMTSLPYTRSQLTAALGATGAPTALGRIVSSGLSVKYIGTELNRAGNIVCFTDPDHSNTNNRSYNDIVARSESEISSPDSDRSKCWISIYGQNTSETNYPEIAAAMSFAEVSLRTCYPLSSEEAINNIGAADAGFGAVPMVVWVTGVAGQQYQFELVTHCEYIGPSTESFVSPNTTDADGFQLVQTAASMMYSEKANRPHTPLPKIMKSALNMAWKKATSKESLKAGAMLLSTLI